MLCNKKRVQYLTACRPLCAAFITACLMVSPIRLLRVAADGERHARHKGQVATLAYDASLARVRHS